MLGSGQGLTLTLAPDIRLASSKGIDAFALNVGRDDWQPARVADAFAAAKYLDNGFQLFMSFDMASLPCANDYDADVLMSYITAYENHPNYLKYNRKMFVSTFSGQDCRFGTSSLNEGWANAVKKGPDIHFVPAFFNNPAEFRGMTVMDGAFNVSCNYESFIAASFLNIVTFVVEFSLANGKL